MSNKFIGQDQIRLLTMAMKYYYDLMSQPSRAIYIFLKANGIEFEPKPIKLRKGEHFSEEFTKINPWQKVPVIDDQGFILTERSLCSSSDTRILSTPNVKLKSYGQCSFAYHGPTTGNSLPIALRHQKESDCFSIAILRYLSCKYNVAEHWYPRKNLHSQARVEEYLHWQHLNTRMNAAMVFQHKLLIPMTKGTQIDQKQVERFKTTLTKIIDHIDNYFLKDHNFIGGDDISVADLLGVCELMQLYSVFEEDIYKSNPKVYAWMERVKETLKPFFDEGHEVVYRTRDTFKKLGSTLGAKL